jgi:hypothetical protein
LELQLSVLMAKVFFGRAAYAWEQKTEVLCRI